MYMFRVRIELDLQQRSYYSFHQLVIYWILGGIFTFWLTIFSLEVGFWDDMVVSKSKMGCMVNIGLPLRSRMYLEHRLPSTNHSPSSTDLILNIGIVYRWTVQRCSSQHGTSVAYDINSQEDYRGS